VGGDRSISARVGVRPLYLEHLPQIAARSSSDQRRPRGAICRPAAPTAAGQDPRGRTFARSLSYEYFRRPKALTRRDLWSGRREMQRHANRLAKGPTHYELQAGRLAESTCAVQSPLKSGYVHRGLLDWLPGWPPDLSVSNSARCSPSRSVRKGGAQPWARLIPAEAAPSVSPSMVNASAGPRAPLPSILPCWPQIAAQARNSAVNL
jgi:hypothetical protein